LIRELAYRHIYEHEVDESEVEDILKGPGEIGSGRDGAKVVTGQTRAGRYLRVIYVPDAKRAGLFVITAYEIDGKSLQAYRRRQHKKSARRK
jgi:hypothetical protein